MSMNATSLCLRDIDFLFAPFVSRKLVLSSRLVMSPVQRFFALDGVPTVDMLRYYCRRAAHGVGLILTEPVAVPDAVSAVDSGMACFYGGAAFRAWRRIARLIHTTTCSIAPLLTHAGMLHRKISAAQACGPSTLPLLPGMHGSERMSHARIEEVAEAFGRAASAARVLGFDAVCINGADAHLIEQFLRKESNRRNDEYGGDICGRSRFACRVVHAVRKAVGRHFPILFRFAQYSSMFGRNPLVGSPVELRALLEPLCDAGVDIFCCVDTQASLPTFGGSPLNLAGWARLLTGRPVITEGAVGLPGVQIEPLVQRMRAREFDLISVGRALLADAEWASKLRQARESDILPFTRRSWLHLY